jgi:hypothetical protein
MSAVNELIKFLKIVNASPDSDEEGGRRAAKRAGLFASDANRADIADAIPQLRSHVRPVFSTMARGALLGNVRWQHIIQRALDGLEKMPRQKRGQGNGC